jgi:hypothetical protein
MFRSAKWRVGLSAAVAVALVGLLTIAVLAARGVFARSSAPTPVTITDQLVFGHPPHGTFAATAAVCSAGTFVDDVQIAADGSKTVHETFTCGDGKGTFIVVFHPTQDGGSVPWSVVRGTRAYATLHGSGTRALVQNGPASAIATFTGHVYFG